MMFTLRGSEVQARQAGNSSSNGGGGGGLPELAALSADEAAAAAAEAEAIAAAAAARASEEDRLPRALAWTVMELALRSVVQLLAVGDQQQVPLQALQLLAAVRQVELTAQEVCNTVTPPPPTAAAEALDVKDSTAAPATDDSAHQAAQQQLVQQSLQLLQHVRAIEGHSAASCTAEQTAAVGAASCRPAAAANGWEGSSITSSSSSSAVLSPSQFFASDGPLSAFWGFQDPAELSGLWQAAPDPGIHSAAVSGSTAAAEGALEAGCSSRQTGPGSSPCSSGQQPPEGQPIGTGHQLQGVSQQQQEQQQQQVQKVLEVLRASALSCTAQRQASAALEDMLGLNMISDVFEEIAAFTVGTSQVSLQIIGPEFNRCASMLQQATGHRAVLVGSKEIMRVWCLYEPLVSLMAHARSTVCSMLGLPAFDAVAWQRLASVGRRFDDEHMDDVGLDGTSAKGRGGSKQHPDSDNSSDSSDSDSDYAEGTDSTTADAAAGSSRASRWGSSWSSSGGSSSGSSSLSKNHWQSGIAVDFTQQHVQRFLSGNQLSSENRGEQAQMQDSVVQAAGTLRCASWAGCLDMLCSPNRRWWSFQLGAASVRLCCFLQARPAFRQAGLFSTPQVCAGTACVSLWQLLRSVLGPPQ
jgi:hypothetical protein